MENAARPEVPLQAQKMEVLGRLAGAVIHDLNNLLTVIQLNAGLIEIGGLSEPDTLAAAGRIEEATCRAADLTRKVLNFSRGQPEETGDVNLHDTVTGLSRLLEPLIARRVTVGIAATGRDLWVHGSRSAIEQALMNLILNAVDAMPGGGRVEITFREGMLPQGGASAGVVVRDEGAGISSEHQARIFEPFFTTKESGTGMGLAIVHRIARAHGGAVDFDTTPGRGTEFRLWLPAVAAPDRGFEKGAPRVPAGFSGRTVLLVEDDPGILLLTRQLLEAQGLHVLPAATAEDALECWGGHRGRVDLLLTDIVLPGEMSGRDLAQRILASTPDLPVLYMSGYGGAGDDQSWLTEENFLPKPFPAQALERAVARLLARP